MRNSRGSTKIPHLAKPLSFLAVLVLTALTLQTTPAAAAQTELLGPDPLAGLTEVKGNPTPPQYQTVPVTGNPNFTKAVQITTTTAPASAGLDGEYEITLGAPTQATANLNDAAVATFWARSITPPAGQDAGYATFVFERDGGSYHKSANAALRFTSTWQKFTFPFHVTEQYAPGEAHINFWLGYGPQTFQVAGLSVTDWGPGEPAGFPKITYAGRETNATWRTAANQRIDQYRKGNLAVHVVDQDGKPINTAGVNVDMQKHAFRFGTAVDARTMMANNADGAKYRQIVTGGDFNQITFGNDLKWQHWDNATERETIAKPTLKWARQNGLAFRGHNLVWPSWGYLPTDLQALKDDKPALRARVDNHITDETSSLVGSVDNWDVVNEPYSEHNLQDIFGPDEINRWYVLAKQGDPRARMVLNDYGVIENNGWSKRHQDYFYNLAKRIHDGPYGTPYPLEGLGLESHFTGLQPTPPEDLYNLLNRYATLGLPMEATEFDMITPDEQLQADYTRDFMTMMFSHPDVTGISTFGIWENNIWDPLAALYRSDWSLKPNGQVWHDLVTRQWWTNAHGTTNGAGDYSTRGFLGDYLITVMANGAIEKVHVSMPTNAGASVTIVADGTASDDTEILGNGGGEYGNVGWYGFSPSTVAPEVTTVHSGTGAIRSGGRTAEWQGPAEGVQVASGQTYTSGAWLRLASGGDTTGLIEVKLSYTDGTTQTVPLASGPVTAGGWSQVKSTAPVPFDFNGKTLAKAEYWISTTSGTGDLLVDDASLRNGA